MTSTVPAWLDVPSDADSLSLPVLTRHQGLPLGELTWSNFERLVLRLVRRDKDILDCVLYGTQGEEQSGIDILATSRKTADKHTCYQCKKVKKFSPTKIREAVDTFLAGAWAQRTSHYVLCTASPLATTKQLEEIDKQRRRLRRRGIELAVWDGSPASALVERLKPLPDLVDDFFGRSWVVAFNGEAAAEELGERLDGFETAALRRRLATLYSTVFTQHDPGIRIDGPTRVDYLDRYVPIDVTERSSLSAPALQAAPLVELTEQASTDNNARQELKNVASGTYEIRQPALDWLRGQDACVLLGEPGHGKSAVLRFISLSLLNPDTLNTTAFDHVHLQRLPVWMSFGRFSTAIEMHSSLSVDDFFRDWLHQHSFEDTGPLFARALRQSKILLLVDGLDEFVSERHAREALLRIVSFVTSRGAIAICTSRPRGFRTLGVPTNWLTATLASLTDSQIELLANRWFAITESQDSRSSDSKNTLFARAQPRANAFLNAVKGNQRTYELARNPLLCQALIELFRYSHRMPEGRVVAYHQIVDLLLSRHPQARAQAAYSGQPTDRLGLRPSDLREIVLRIAAEMQTSAQRGILPTARCVDVCAEYLSDEVVGLGLPKAQARRQATQVVTQLVDQFGILVERAPGENSFLHLSLQEFLAAEWIGRKPHEEQLAWLSNSWLESTWRECLTSWFGIHGSNGQKVLTSQALQLIAKLGEDGELQRMQSLDLRTELACSDLAVPIGEARRIVAQAADEVVSSAMTEYRTSLARNLTIGALGVPLRDECCEAIRTWVPSRPGSRRARLLTAFATWQPAEDLKRALARGLHDEDQLCRRAAAKSFTEVFGDQPIVSSVLADLAATNLRPEVRATALWALSRRRDWSALAIERANANLNSQSAELLVAATQIRVTHGLHSDDDFQRMWRMWSQDAIDYWSRSDFSDVLFDGWRHDPRLRSTFVRHIKTRWSSLEIAPALEHLVRAFPRDKEIAELVAASIGGRGNYILDRGDRFWTFLSEGYREDPIVGSALRKMLATYREKHKPIFWHPNVIPAFVVIGDDAARDELLDAYAEPDTDARGRHWIAKTLIDGWPNDSKASRRLRDWAAQDAQLSAPLAKWARVLFSEKEERHAWLERTVRTAHAEILIDAAIALLEEFPDENSRVAIESRLDDPRLWYYHATRIQGLLTRHFPTSQLGQRVLERSFSELDGPALGDFASSFESNTAVRQRLLRAASAAPTDVRLAVATVLQDRASSLEVIRHIFPDVLAEDSSAVRAGALIAHGQAMKRNGTPTHAFEKSLLEEVSSTGTRMTSRRRAALAALLEIGDHEAIADTLAGEHQRDWFFDITGHLEKDPVSVGTLIRHWQSLEPKLRARGLEDELPIVEIIDAGYAQLLEQVAHTRDCLDQHLQSQPSRVVSISYLELLARRFPHALHFKDLLLESLLKSNGSAIQCTAARLLADHFSNDRGAMERLDAPSDFVRMSASWAPGVLGHLTRGFPTSSFAQLGLQTLNNANANEVPRDLLILGVALNRPDRAQQAAEALLSEPLRDWRYRLEDTQALLLWARDASGTATVERWVDSADPTLRITATAVVAKIGLTQATVDKLRQRFNETALNRGHVPEDGLDAVNGQVMTWPVRAYSAISAFTRE